MIQQTPALQAVVNVKSAFDRYGQAIKRGCKCPVCGRNVPFMPVQGFCSIDCFI